jgi:hypothetical protein
MEESGVLRIPIGTSEQCTLGESESKAHLAENRESYRQLTYRLTFNILLEARRVSMAVGVRTWLKQLRARLPRGA